jgi:light-regulated signal transduction histidine kinase (bacteriophytochrome)
VKDIVEAHGGRVWVESAPGQGSTFYLSLKIADPGDEGAAQMPEAESSHAFGT